MTLNSIRQAGVSAATLGLCCVALANAPAVHAQDKWTAQSLIDRQLILDQITRYYYNFGKAERQAEESFYAEDGELILGTRHYKGREGIKSAYNRAPAAPAAGAPLPLVRLLLLPPQRPLRRPLRRVRGSRSTSKLGTR
jgi:hypothetical protein